MEIWVVLNTTASTNIFAGVYGSLLEAQKAVTLTYKNQAGGRVNESVTFNPVPPTGDYRTYPATYSPVINNQCTYTTQYGDKGTIIRMLTAKAIGTDEGKLFGF